MVAAFASLSAEWTDILIFVYCEAFIGEIPGLYWKLNIFVVFVMCRGFASANAETYTE
jgi:hypothetical protein